MDVLHRLETDPSTCAAELDWVAKQQVLEGYRERDGLDWSDPRLRRRRHPVERRASGEGAVPAARRPRTDDQLVDEAAVEAAVTTPPEDTRAWFRGTCLDKWPTQIAAASWDSVIFDVPGRQALQRVPMLEPERGTKAHVGAILDRSPDVITLLRGARRGSGLGWSMATQEHSRPQRREGEPEPEPEAPVAPEASARKEALDDDIDTVLDEIDGVLEANAEEFVRGFVQKGGQ